ncbi:NACHT, LRR and PYD domains-containing protein 3-like isoform X2 [Clupea harengus]|uniref:NACHT, LRR and PYD domains-containing protein 3-like isoform X2 n=1 Tax=Clupea harengus TaxID=7950 RepID=A0A6P8F3X4_CLUHA|nr:NACHT, LRR and PYD domains-containing protein 3-like isoform X2 [Clupea harengus]XP_042559663.1 NACHT, LRR and PYD domains-containing protein 3-like isoform X2 [Clupea harengus]
MSQHRDSGGRHGDTRPTTQKGRSNTSAPSCVSMKSDRSKEDYINFSEGQSHPDPRPTTQKGRSNTSAPSCVSMKSDRSKEDYINFSEGQSHPDPSVQQEEQTVHPSFSKVNRKELSTVFKELEHKVITFMTNELKRLKSFLTHDYPESPCNEEDYQRDTRDGALKIAVQILRNMNQEIIAQQLEKCGLFPKCQEALKHSLKEKFQRIFEGVPKLGSPTLLDKIYTELYITEGESVEVNTEHEVRQIEMASKRQITMRETPIKCTEIFRPLPGQDKLIRTVLTKGVAGIGKTVSVQKFILDWAKGKANQNILFIFPLPFRELNLIKEKKYTLIDVIHHFFSETEDFAFSNQDRYNIAFIFDGLDESRLPLDFQHNECIYNVSEPASVDVLLTNLIKGNLLPSALVWITSRPGAVNQIPPECVDQVTEVRGFNDPQKEEYFRKRITKKKLAKRIITHLKSSRTLYIMCHIPVFCWMAATVLEYILTKAESGEIPTSLSQMYTHFLIIQTKHMSQKYGNRDADALWNLKTILSLGKLAFQQLEKGNLIFYEEDLRECGIDITEASVHSGMCTQIFREEAGLFQGKVFCFVHLSIQEFLAALYVFLHFSKRESNVPEQHNTSLLYSLLSANKLLDIQQTAVDLALRNENGQLDLFLRFLLGLSLESNQKLLQDLLPQTGCSSLNTEETVKYIKKKIREDPNPERCINLFHCLNELNDHSLVEEVNGYLRKGKGARQDLSPSQLSALAFVQLMSDQELEEFNLGDYGGGGSPARSDVGLIRMLPVVEASRSVKLVNCNITKKSCAVLSSALCSNCSSLRQLDLTDNYLGDSGVELLSTGLEHPDCRLEKLELLGCKLTEKSCAALSSALSSNSSRLRQLDLGDNNLGDSGVELLSTGLKHPNCSLEKLGLMDCKLTVKICAALSSTLSSNSSSLRQLDLSGNNLGDSGVKLLCTGLRHPNFRLKNLELVDCNITKKSCAALSSALCSNVSSLRQLDLNNNNLGDSGVELLSTGLKHPNCSLEKLGLIDCNITKKSCVPLSSALSSNSSSLRQLHLSDNYLGDSGVELLSTGLVHPNCRLEKLGLRCCGLTVRSCYTLASALRSNLSSLRELDLRGNNLQQSYVELLSALQKDPEYRLTELEY